MPAPRRSVRKGGGASKLPHRQANGPFRLPPADGGRSLVEPAGRSADAFIQHAGKLLRPAQRLGERRPDGGTEITADGDAGASRSQALALHYTPQLDLARGTAVAR